MASNVKKLDDILNKTDDWEAPNLKDLEGALGSLERVLADLSQTDDVKWSGAAAESAAEAFDLLRERYRRVKNALADVGPAVTQANAARARAKAALNDLPDPDVPSWIQTAVSTAKKVGDVHVVIDGYAYVADQAVGIYENWLGNRREQEAAQILVDLQEELEAPGVTLKDSKDEIDKALEREIEIDDDEAETGGGGGGPTPVPPVPPVPGPHLGRVPRAPGDDGLLGVERPGSWSGPGPHPGYGHVPTPGVPDDIYLGSRRETVPEDHSSPHANDPWGRGQGPSVDSGSSGTSGSNGFAAGVMGGGAAAGAAALRWGTGAGGPGARGFGAPGVGAPGVGAPGGVGGLLGGGGSAGGAGGPGAAGGVAGGRGMAAGLPGGGAGGAGGAGSSAAGGAGANSSAAGAKGGMVGGGAGAPGGGGSAKKGKGSGLSGHIVPKFEDDDDFVPQSEAARAGSRDDFL